MMSAVASRIQPWVYAVAIFALTVSVHHEPATLASAGAATALAAIAALLAHRATMVAALPGLSRVPAGTGRREHARRTDVPRHCDPDAPGRARPRAPGHASLS